MSKNFVKKHRGLIGIPHMGTFPWQTVAAIQNLQQPKNTEFVRFNLVGSSVIYDAREKILKQAIDEGLDWLLFLDSDMVPPSNSIQILHEMCFKHDVDIACGMFFKRIAPFQPCFYSTCKVDQETKKPILESPIIFPKHGILQLEGMGMACTMIKIKSVLDKMKHDELKFFPFPGFGEDLSFCLRAKMAGMKMYVSLDLKVGHVGTMDFGFEHFKACRDQHLKSENKETLYKEV